MMTAPAGSARALGATTLQMREIWLHGRLRKKYGSPFRMAIKTPGEAIRALSSQLKGFKRDVQAMDFWMVYGDLRRGVKLPIDCVDMGLGARPLHFYPVPQGAKSGSTGGFLKIVAGAALVTASFFAPELAPIIGTTAASILGTAALGIGASLFLGGISSLISPHPQSTTSQQTTPGYVFQGPANVTSQGVAIPLCYGTCMCGTVVIAASLSNGDILDGQLGTTSKLGQIWSGSS